MAGATSAESILRISSLEVRLGGRKVGVLAQPSHREGVSFEYDNAWIAEGYSISPFSLPLQSGVMTPEPRAPEGLFGVFRDSLPDDWGRLLVNRVLARAGVEPGVVTPLARLAIVGEDGLGALEYRNPVELGMQAGDSGLDELFEQSMLVLEDAPGHALDELYARGSSSGGARPKLNVDIGGEPWIVKFPLSTEEPSAGADEYLYSLAASQCGIDMPETRLLPSEQCGGFFAVKRFDRVRTADGQIKKTHMASAAALLEADPLDDTLDYKDLFRLTQELTRNAQDVEQLFRVMCFNVFAGNCDDHMRNFSFLCSDGIWRLSPAYDLTPNPGFFGEHSILVNGRGADIGDSDLKVAGAAGSMSSRAMERVIREVRAGVREVLPTAVL